MSEHRAIISWERSGPDFPKGKFSREHTWSFDGGITLPASASPSVVPPPYSSAAGVDPEEAFVASVSSCHMLTFVFLASRQGILVDRYRDEAVGIMTKGPNGVPWVSRITLRPAIAFGGSAAPDAAAVGRLHHLAHEQCFIANSVRTEIVVEPAP